MARSATAAKALPQRRTSSGPKLGVQLPKGSTASPLASTIAEPAKVKPAGALEMADLDDDLPEEVSAASQRRKEENIKAMLGKRYKQDPPPNCKATTIL